MFNKLTWAVIISISILSLPACSDEDGEPKIGVPTTYEFTREGQSTVSYQGQTDRLNMLSEIKAYLRKGDAGEQLDAGVLLNMYANENNPFADPALNSSTKQLKDKTFVGKDLFFENLFAAADAASSDVVANNSVATAGVSGRIERGDGTGNFILVNEKGWEFTQFVEKGLMGAVIYNQIFNTYMSDAKVGDDVENTALVDGKNYTPMEHYWDEAFGYWGVPVDFPQGDPVLEPAEDRFWAAYTFDRDVFLNVNQTLMNAYLTGRTAIVNKDYALKNEQREEIYYQHELVAAATAVHYINDAIDYLVQEDQGNFFHSLSEAYAFVDAIFYSPKKQLSAAQIDTILNENFGTDGDFWTVTIEGLQNAKATISSTYPEIKNIADQL